MTTPLRKFGESSTPSRLQVALRRYHGKTNGLGFLAARDYLMKTGQMPVVEDKPRVIGEDKPKRKPKKSKDKSEQQIK